MDVQSHKASALIGALQRSVVLKRQLSKRAKTLGVQIYISPLSHL